MAQPLMLTVWCRSPEGRQSVAGERSLAQPTYEEFATAFLEIMASVAPPNSPSLASCDWGTLYCGGGGPISSLEDGVDVDDVIRYLWRRTAMDA